MKRAKLSPARKAKRSTIQPIGMAPAGKGPERVYLAGSKGSLNARPKKKFGSVRMSPKLRRRYR